MAAVAINGLGRIGRAALRQLMEDDRLEVVAVNDLVPADNLAYLLRYDTVYGRWPGTVRASEDALEIDGKAIPALQETEPDRLPWAELGIDVVLECTGVFRERQGLERHLAAGAGRVVLSAPAKDDAIPTVVPGVNDVASDEPIVSTASCTTNCIAPIVEIWDRRFGVTKATMTTLHAYTSSQELVDAPAGKWRRGRAAAANLVPTTTGAALATAKVLPQVTDRFDGAAVRAPVAVGSIADIVAVLDRAAGVVELNDALREEAEGERYRGIIDVAEAPLVSADVVGQPLAAIADLTTTQVVAGDLAKVMAWYDNEWGYVAQMLWQVRRMAGTGQGGFEPAEAPRYTPQARAGDREPTPGPGYTLRVALAGEPSTGARSLAAAGRCRHEWLLGRFRTPCRPYLPWNPCRPWRGRGRRHPPLRARACRPRAPRCSAADRRSTPRSAGPSG
jgi:glyceraldehyde 3-phosphate dehydrogenase